jgi:hypothetical protein
MSQAFKITITVILAVIIICGGIFAWQNSQSTSAPEPSEESAEKILIISIIIPEDYDSYRQAIAEFVQTGGPDPLLDTKFIKKTLAIPFTEDRILASAQSAAAEIYTGGGPEKATVDYLKIKDGTAYVLLNIDLDAWAGVSLSLAAIHPLVEKTLLQFPEIRQVVFDYAPGDNPETQNFEQ